MGLAVVDEREDARRVLLWTLGVGRLAFQAVDDNDDANDVDDAEDDDVETMHA